MISFYDLFMFPLERMGIRKARRRLINKAEGKVLEIGAGSGVNLNYYDFSNINEIDIIDNDFYDIIYKKLEKKKCNIPCQTHLMDVEKLSFADRTFDTIVFTLLFCSVKDVKKGLSEIKRVLKDDGKVIFIEHVLPIKKGFRKLVKKAAPIWIKFSNGCNLDRDFENSILTSGFKVDQFYRYGNTIFTSGIAYKKE